MKRFEATNTAHEIEPVSYLQICKSGSNYIYAYNNAGTLTILTHTSGADIITNGTSRFTDANLEDVTGLHPCAMRVIGARVYICYINDNVSEHLKYGYSDDDGVNWTWDEAVNGEQGYDLLGAGDYVYDVGIVAGVVYALIQDSLDIRIFELGVGDNYTQLWTKASSLSAIGYIESDEYFFIVYNTFIVSIYAFTGVTATEQEQIYTSAEEILLEDGILLKKGNTRYYFGNYAIGKNTDYYLQVGTGSWVAIAFGADLLMHLTWEEDSYTPRFIHWAGTVDDIYYVTPAGALVKIDNNATETTKNGLGQFLYPYEITPTAYNPGSKVPITGGHLMPQVCEFTHIGTDYTKGDGIILTDDSDNVKFIGVIPPEAGVKDIGGVAQGLTFYSPGKFDLMEKVDYEFLGKTVPEMLTTDLLETRYYYKGTFDASATTYDYSCNQLPRWEFWKDMEELALLKIHKSNEFGAIDLDDGTDKVRKSGFKNTPGVDNWNSDLGGVPTGWAAESAPDIAEVISSHTTHTYPLQMTEAVGFANVIKDYVETSGSIDFWVYLAANVATKGFLFQINNSGGLSLNGVFVQGVDISGRNAAGDGWVDTGVNIAVAEWVHFSFTWDKGVADGSKIYMNGVLIYTEDTANLTPTQLKMRVEGNTVYYDSVGISTDGYTQFSNLYYIVTHTDMMRLPGVKDMGGGFNRIGVLGGVKADGTGLASAAYNIPISTDQQINLVTFTKPNLLTDAACLTAATNLGDNMSTALKSYSFSFIDNGKPLEGEVISFAYSPLSISAVDVIVEKYSHNLLTDVYNCTCYTALHWRGIP